MSDLTYPTYRPKPASPAVRLGGEVLSTIMFFLTLGIGWIIWFAFVAPKGQSPGKQMVGLVTYKDGRRASAGTMWARDFLIKGVLIYVLVVCVLAPVSGGIALLVWIAACAWCLWDKDNQCLWDKAVGTIVVHESEVRGREG